MMRALQVKLGWIIQSQDSLLANYMRAKYISNGYRHNRRLQKAITYMKIYNSQMGGDSGQCLGNRRGFCIET